MRLFAAVVPPRDVLAELDRATRPLRADLPDLRWADRSRMHLTVAFYGEVPDVTAERLTERLARVAHRRRAMELAFAGGGAFPKARKARVLWVGVDGDRDPLRRLADSAVAAGRRLGLGGDERAYRPHLTLARLREPTDVRSHLASLTVFRGSPWRATDLVLFHSTLGPEPKYETLASWPLAT